MKNKIKERMERILRGSILFTTLLTLAFPVQAWAKLVEMKQNIPIQ